MLLAGQQHWLVVRLGGLKLLALTLEQQQRQVVMLPLL
jgi:hypothetical protein